MNLTPLPSICISSPWLWVSSSLCLCTCRSPSPPHSAHPLLSPLLSLCLIPSPYLLSLLLAPVPPQHKQHLGDRSSWAQEEQGSRQGESSEPALWEGASSCYHPDQGHGDSMAHVEGDTGNAVTGACAPGLGDGLGTGVGADAATQNRSRSRAQSHTAVDPIRVLAQNPGKLPTPAISALAATPTT